MDRRVFTRIKIPGAKIQYRKIGLRNLLNILSKPTHIKNLSKSGICFSLDDKLRYGDPIVMKIQFPDGKNIRLRGEIRWQNGLNSDTALHVGVQFLAFGAKTDYNPIEALEYLRAMDGLAFMKPAQPSH